MKIMTSILTAALATFIAAPAQAGGFNPMILAMMMRPMMQMQQRPNAWYSGHRRPLYRRGPRFYGQPLYGGAFVTEGAVGIPQGGYVEGGMQYQSHSYARHEWYRHYESRGAVSAYTPAPVYQAPVRKHRYASHGCGCCCKCDATIAVDPPEVSEQDLTRADMDYLATIYKQ